MLASQLIDDATADLHDAENVRWTRADLLRWLNDGQREVVIYRPDACVSIVDHPLIAGWAQTIPAAGIRLQEVKANTNGVPCKLVKRETLDSILPSWRTAVASATIKQWIYDERTPKAFEVYPPAAVGATLKIAITVTPADCANESVSIALDDQFAGPLRNYMLHRAHGRDSEDAAELQLSNNYYALMAQALTGRTQAELAMRASRAAAVRKDPEA